MPSKGFYTQGLAILLRNAVPVSAVEAQLKDFKIVKRVEAFPPMAGPGVLVAYRPDVNGYMVIDVLDRVWPDQMGDPKTDPTVFGAWHFGEFGPGAWPGGLERACQHSWAWPDGRTIPLQHQAFIRIRSSYVLGADRNVPEDYRSLPELEFATRMASALVRLPEALCFFNPNGECVLGPSEFSESLRYHASAKIMPLNLWSNVRSFKIQGTNPEWAVLDTVGMSQLDAPDHEAIFQSDAYHNDQVKNFLRNASAYVVERGPIINNGDTMDGPGNTRWQGLNIKQGRFVPPRAVVRWLPLDGRTPPAELINAGNE